MRHRVTTDLLYPQLWRSCAGAWAPCLGPSGSTLRDWSGAGNHGTLTGGAAFAVSGNGYAMSLDGTGDYITTPNTRIVTLAQPLSISAWVRLSSLGANQGIWASGKTTGLSAVFLRVHSSNALQYFEESGSFAVSSSSTLSASQWYHVAVVRDGASASVYIDGILKGSSTRLLAAYTQDTTDLIGSIYSAGSVVNNLNGMLDDVRLYSRTLVPSEIALLSRRRGIAYETKRRSRGYVAAAGITGPLIGGRLVGGRALIGGRLVQ